jgi:hypothetical protein
MAYKRLVIDIGEADHHKLKKKALTLNTSLSNYVRRALGLPEERHGVKKEAQKRVAKGVK